MAGLAGCTGPGSTPPGAAATGAATGATVACDYPSDGKAAKAVDKPSTEDVPATGTAKITLQMAAGDLVLDLDRAGAPCAVNSFESLVKQGFYDDTTCHRLVPDFVLQCGDPTGTSSGGPGYRYADELSGQEKYSYGVVAMANAGPDTNGSQFFIVIGANAASLPPSYDVLGTVETGSLTVLGQIAAIGENPAGSQKPAQEIRITSAKLG
ncbi:MAG: peptidylprolyl isomerase [Propionibacteriaceae bacterium]|jgi:peptidyl-prolyl cis-trans isomerase B (cyclophilin B)|nr:peptidylprolyl isomerase [Propionibacteriaceae bacterium]